MSRPWSPSAAEQRRIEAFALYTTATPEQVAKVFNAPADKVRVLMADAKRGIPA